MQIIFNKKYIHLESVNSTNDYAKKIADFNSKNTIDKNLIIISSNEQTSGRGQFSNRWESEKGMNLIFSILFYPPDFKIIDQFYISKAISLAVLDFTKKYSDQATIKWPNDIYLENKKLGGILIENSVMGDLITYSIAGIGLNINQIDFSNELPNPISLRQSTGQIFDLNECLKEFLDFFDYRMNHLFNSEKEIINHDYQNSLYLNGKIAEFFKGNVKFKARIAGVLETGQLILEDLLGNKNFYYFKEVEFCK
jgi:BirA family transcriptional regulator, biotin operon repressor / biotin---[acetyl-CoA-carboxylase] ligase